MTAQPDQEQRLIPQTGAQALWCVDADSRADDPLPSETCEMHVWTCIWCSMTPPICGSCRPVTPPCPANGRVHTCACSATYHSREVD